MQYIISDLSVGRPQLLKSVTAPCLFSKNDLQPEIVLLHHLSNERRGREGRLVFFCDFIKNPKLDTKQGRL